MHTRLAMSLLVRDEASLIEANIRFHSRMGVDCFVVTDNGSKDGTREIVAGLGQECEILLIDEPAHIMQQDRWVNRMARVAETRLGADWIVNSDADEFWHPAKRSLKAEIPADAGVLRCHRSNMLATRSLIDSPDYRFYQNTLRVMRTFDNTEFQAPPWRLTERPFVLTRIGKKVMCRLAGLQSMWYGNHDADHEGASMDSAGIHVYHYPVRTYAEFLSKVLNHGTSIRNNPGLPGNIMWHARRWYALHEQGLLEKEYERLILSEEDAAAHLASGVLELDDTLCRMLAEPAHFPI